MNKANSIAIILVVSLASTGVLALGQAGSQSERLRQDVALRNGGLHAAAALTGQYVARIPVDVGGPVSLGQLVNYSQVILIGQPVNSTSRLVSDGYSISLFDTVIVERVLKGPTGSLVTVVLPGGRVTFPDGSTAELKTPDFKKPAPGTTYLWFLRSAAESLVRGHEGVIAQGGAFVPSYGPLGIFTTSGSVVESSALYTTWFLRDLRLKRTSPASLLAEVEALLR